MPFLSVLLSLFSAVAAVMNVGRPCKDAPDVVDDSGESCDPQNPELKDPTICTNCRNLSIQSLQLGDPTFYMTPSHQLMGIMIY